MPDKSEDAFMYETVRYLYLDRQKVNPGRVLNDIRWRDSKPQEHFKMPRSIQTECAIPTV